MDKKLQPIVAKLEKEFGGTASEYRGDASLVVPAEKIVAACQQVQGLGFELLSALTAVDYWPQEDPRFHVIYQFTSVSTNLRLDPARAGAGHQPIPADRFPPLPQRQLARARVVGHVRHQVPRVTLTCAAS